VTHILKALGFRLFVDAAGNSAFTEYGSDGEPTGRKISFLVLRLPWGRRLIHWGYYAE
jgi:hypothetical protein